LAVGPGAASQPTRRRPPSTRSGPARARPGRSPLFPETLVARSRSPGSILGRAMRLAAPASPAAPQFLQVAGPRGRPAMGRGAWGGEDDPEGVGGARVELCAGRGRFGEGDAVGCDEL